MCVEDNIIPLMKINTITVEIFSKIDVFHSLKNYIKNNYIGKDSFKNAMEYVDLVRLTVFIYTFTGLIHNMLDDGLAFPLYLSQILINWRKEHITFFEFFANKINRKTY